MKRCPNCHQSFSDDLVFCLNDGTVLENSATSFSGDMPTVVAQPFANQKVEKTNKSFYAIIGAMAVVILGLAAIVFFLVSGEKDDKKEENISNTAQNSQSGNQTSEKSPITKQIAQDLINRWEKAQDTRNFDDYRSCYAPEFVGIKRTKTGSENQMNYSQWMTDREKMAHNIIDVSVENLNITIDGDTAIAQFIQNWQSVNYQDRGQKTMRIKMFAGEAKIVYEDLKFVYSN